MDLNSTFTFFEILEFRNTNLIIFEILLSIIFFPLIGFLVSITKTINQSICVLLTIFLIFNSFILSLYIFFLNLKQPNILFIKISSWINVGNINITYSFLFDSLTIVMLLTVTLISFLVNIYSLAYIDKEANLNRFIAFLSIFTFFMLILISAGNFLLMFLGWEGVGLTSYLLINFFHHRIDANKSAIKAVIVNRIGDFFFFFSIILIIFVFKCLDFILISLLIPFFVNFKISLLGNDYGVLTIISLFLVLAACAKSSQFALHTWLPDAMEGPTPVSALIHAATMVTAGIFVLIRISFILEFVPNILTYSYFNR